MNRIKTLSFPLITALAAATAMSASARLTFEVSSQKTYRQDKNGINFQGGTFSATLIDGLIVYIAGCDFFQYIPPGYYTGGCSPGTNGRVISGKIGGASRANPYLLVVNVDPASVIEPRQAKLVRLTAGPASTLPRPQGGFSDSSVSLYYNLQASQQKEYVVTRYSFENFYSSSERGKFESDIVPGVYRYSFPRLGQPNIPTPVSARIYPMPEGLGRKNNVTTGFEFTSVNDNKWTKDGFMELSYLNPNTITWKPLSPSNTLLGADSLSFSIRVLANSASPKSGIDSIDSNSGRRQSIFPDYINDGDPKLLLTNPYTTNFVVPPILAGGTRGMVEVEVNRALTTIGVAYDTSVRKFQIPVTVVNKFSEYQDAVFFKKGANQNILDDYDHDGINNLNEWILDSNAADSTSVPEAPFPNAVEALYDLDYLTFFGRTRLVRNQYFGFTISKKLGTDPRVVYTLQRSMDGGVTWKSFKSGYYFADGSYSKTYIRSSTDLRIVNWVVKTVKLAPGISSVKENSPQREEIRVESGYPYTDGIAIGDSTQIRPPGTEGETYRVKITLRK
jgi:hypothetical protein